MSNYTSDEDTNDLITSFLLDGDYRDRDGKPDLNAWMADSDYTIGENEWLEVVWFYEGNQVDATDCVIAAIEASGFRRAWRLSIELVAEGDDPWSALEEWIAHNGADMIPVVDCENEVTGYRPLG